MMDSSCSYLHSIPMAMMLLNLNATVTICHSRTKDLKDIIKGKQKDIDDYFKKIEQEMNFLLPYDDVLHLSKQNR